jgi:CheY-like chemotaxis protein
MLEELKHNVLEASSGRAALAVLDRQPMDLLITDQGMPGMTGVQLALLVRDKWPKTRIIIATGYAELPEGSPSFPRLNKPFLEAELERAIASVAAPDA